MNYTGEIIAKFKPTSEFTGPQFSITKINYNVGERIVQLIIMPIPTIELEEVEELDTTERGTGSFGSTGK